jgi:hypothetical protein
MIRSTCSDKLKVDDDGHVATKRYASYLIADWRRDDHAERIIFLSMLYYNT